MRKISQEYFDLFRKAVEEDEGVLIPTASKIEAQNLRSYLYHFRSHIRESQPDFLQGKFEQLRFTIEPRGLLVHIPAAPGVNAIRQTIR